MDAKQNLNSSLPWYAPLVGTAVLTCTQIAFYLALSGPSSVARRMIPLEAPLLFALFYLVALFFCRYCTSPRRMTLRRALCHLTIGGSLCCR